MVQLCKLFSELTCDEIEAETKRIQRIVRIKHKKALAKATFCEFHRNKPTKHGA